MTASSAQQGGRAARRPLVRRDGDPVDHPHAVAAIGNFDGIHLGHRRLIGAAVREARELGHPAAILTFDPHPRDFFRPGAPAFRLTPEAEKLKILGALGIDVVFLRRFDAALAATSAESFVREVLSGTLRLTTVVIGGNFHFGRGREGTPAILAALAADHGMAARIEPAVEIDGDVVSSSRIRTALVAGDVAAANRLLGYRWFVGGTVGHGDKRGRTLGFPTANLRLPDGCGLGHGIYAVRAALDDGRVLDGVASYGRRPTFDDGPPLLETFLFDFAGDLYGRRLEVEFVDWIRGEERFGSADELVAAMNRDAGQARAALAAPPAERSFIG